MKKSKSKSLLDVCLLGAAVLFGALTMLLMIAPGIINDIILAEERISVYGLINYADELKFGVLLAVIFAACLLVSALLSLVLKLMGKKTKADALIAFCAGILGVIAGILLFMTKSLVGLADSGITSLGIGAILGGVFAIIGGLALVGYAALKMKK